MPLFGLSSINRSTVPHQAGQDKTSHTSSLFPWTSRQRANRSANPTTGTVAASSRTNPSTVAREACSAGEPALQPKLPPTPSPLNQQGLGTSIRSEPSDFDHVSQENHSVLPSKVDVGPAIGALTKPSMPIESAQAPPQGLLQSSLPARLVVSCESGQYARPLDCVLVWQDVSEWYNFWQKAEMRLAESGKYSPDDDTTRLYLQSGSAHIVCTGSKSDNQSCFLENQKDWAVQLQRMIANFVANFVVHNPDVSFFVEIRWNFAILSLPYDNEGSLKGSIRTAISNHSDKNWDGKEFIPRNVLKSIFTRKNVRNLLTHDNSLTNVDLKDPGRRWSNLETFTEYVYVNAVALLAMFVCGKTDMICLYHLLKNCPVGGPIPVVDRLLAESDRPDGADPMDFKILCGMQSHFRTHTFHFDPTNRVHTHEKLDADVVVPVLNEQQNNKKRLGGGAFGDVYQIRIHSDHHKFDSNRAKVYALKVFRDDRFDGGDDFKAEEAALRRLATKPHRNLVVHLAAWTQNNKFYMLFPCARENLRQYLHRQAPKSSGIFILNLLRQLRDLSGAVEHIHRLAPGGLGNPAGDKLEPTSGQQRATGLHYDLKPENVLLFPGNSQEGDIWKISDFGTARIHGIVVSESRPLQQGYKSHKTKTPTKGDPLYGAPDYALKGETSRPYDVWSLGCILLEILLWACHREYWQKDQFADDRLESPPMKGHQSQAFWYENENKIRLKPIVIELIETLQQICNGWGVMPDLVNMVSDMLRLRAENRPQAAVIRSNMESLIFQADVDLEEDPQLYDEPRGRSGKRLAAPPSNNGSRTRTGSIDREAIPVPSRLRTDDQSAQQRPGHRYTDSGYRADLAETESAVGGAGQHLVIDTNVSPHTHRSRSPSIKIRSPEGKCHLEYEGNPAEEEPPMPLRTEFSSRDLGPQER